jgi:type I restriction enzyme, S subunit
MTAGRLRAVRLGSLGEVLTGRTPRASRPELFGDTHPFITPTDIDGENRYIRTGRHLSDAGADALQRIALPEGAICVVCIGATIGKVCMTSRLSFTNQQINAIVVDTSRYDPAYVFHSLRLLKDDLRARAGGAATPIINKSAFCEVEILVPSLAVQKAVGAVLSAYDDLIENCEQRIRVLDEMARALYREWFMLFRYPGYEKVPLVNSSLGRIPKAWRAAPIKDLCASINYGYTAKASLGPSGPKFLRITDIVSTVIKWADVPWCDPPPEDPAKYALAPGDIVVARTGATTGYAKRLNRPHPDAVFASYLVRVRVDDDAASNRALGILMESEDYKAFVRRNLGGAAQPNANAQVLTSMVIPIPPRGLSRLFDEFSAPILDQAELLAAQAANLGKTRDLLLPKLLSGQVELKDTR